MTTDSPGPACRDVSALWDGVARDFLDGDGVSRELETWAGSYRGRDEAAVQSWALPELFLGPLTKPRGVFLALNPGDADCRFHARGGVFSDEIRNKYNGSYSAWAASWPYLRDPWCNEKGENKHHRSRLRFLSDWTGERELLPGSAMVSFELYPWHSPRLTAKSSGRRAGRRFLSTGAGAARFRGSAVAGGGTSRTMAAGRSVSGLRGMPEMVVLPGGGVAPEPLRGHGRRVPSVRVGHGRRYGRPL